MTRGKKRSFAEREAPIGDMRSLKIPTPINSSSKSDIQPNSSFPGEVSDPPNKHHTSRRRSAIAASSAIAKAAQHLNESDEEVETKHRVKRVTFAEDIQTEIPDSNAPVLTSSTPPSNSNAKMTEVRARAARHKGQMNFEAERTSTPR